MHYVFGVALFRLANKNESEKSKERNSPNCAYLRYFNFFENFILVVEQFSKALGIFETCALVDNNLWRKF